MGRIDGLVQAARYKKDPAVRAEARRALTGFLDDIIKRLQTNNIVQLNTAREALCIVGEPARDRLLHILREGHVHRRQDAAFVLGMMGDPEAVPALQLSMHNPDPLLRLLCVQALAKIDDPRSTQTLELALNDPEPKIVSEARKGLAKRR
jgi:HEAT repeat protein